jgi:plastocyanin
MRTGRLIVLLMVLLGGGPAVLAAQSDHGGHQGMGRDETGMVMNANRDTLPRGCDEVSREHEFTVRAGVAYAEGRPGTVFGLSQHEYRVAPCSRVTVTFINEDEVRHQWMVHGLPSYLYPGGMFHLEAAGGHSQTGTFIVPSDDRTYLVHCDMAQHMEKGMKAQLKVGRGSGDLPSIPTVSGPIEPDSYPPAAWGWWLAGAGLAGFLLTLPAARFLRRPGGSRDRRD